MSEQDDQFGFPPPPPTPARQSSRTWVIFGAAFVVLFLWLQSPLAILLGLVGAFVIARRRRLAPSQSQLRTPSSSRTPRRGSTFVLGGILFALAPMLITLVASFFVDDAFNEGTSTWGTLPWLTIFTLPIGGGIAAFGLVVGAKNIAQRPK